MAKVTGKFQITLPKVLVDQCGIRVGDELELKSIGQAIQIERRNTAGATRARHERLNHFDGATKRQAARRVPSGLRAARSRGWKREELYVRGRSR
jgi:bifunctional DNA-binding transcriptional regulator/antitoxin component of YhaV-PrlF toxin-antitoxin module